MKKIVFALLCLTLLLVFAGCIRSKETMILDFKVTDVLNIEIFKFIVPMEAKGMTVTESEDIEQIITSFSEIRIKRNAIDGDEIVGGEVLSFRFNLEDGKEFMIAYWEDVLRNPNGINYKVSANSLETLWNNLNYDKKSVSESELPIINK